MHVVLTPLFSSCRMQHWARRLEQEVDGVMRIFGGVQQLREVSLQPLLPSLQGLSWGWEWEEAFRNKERGKPGLVRSMGQVWGRWGNSRKAATPRGLATLPRGRWRQHLAGSVKVSGSPGLQRVRSVLGGSPGPRGALGQGCTEAGGTALSQTSPQSSAARSARRLTLGLASEGSRREGD